MKTKSAKEMYKLSQEPAGIEISKQKDSKILKYAIGFVDKDLKSISCDQFGCWFAVGRKEATAIARSIRKTFGLPIVRKPIKD